MKKHNINLAVLLIFFFLGAACSSEPGIDKSKFKKLNASAHALKTARIGGASYRQLTEQAVNLSAEVIALKNKVTTKEEKELLDAYSDLSGMYHDGLLLWKYQLEFAPFDFVPKGRIYVGQDIEPIVSKYHFTTESHLYRPTGQQWKSLPEDSIMIVWNNADAQLKIIENMANYR
ncbi:exported hypothetical protein [Candidatus Sulfobium mesophilum]|uniref:Lipoprotein n=1 Tax=Candidatus Sulfobium mesophilum TaxID=2016548 RepID=A0A2U3QKB1_9BACT|nr:exported hypothetical protein [Candidatus Sulfobium mesophilum]